MMMVVLGAKQRTEADFRGLLKSADSRYRVSILRRSIGIEAANVRARSRISTRREI